MIFKLPLPSIHNTLPILDVYLPMMKASAIVAAANLGLFETLSKGPLSLKELANALQASETGTHKLAHFLTTVDYLSYTEDHKFANTDNTQQWFTSRGDVNYNSGLQWTHDIWGMMGELSDAVKRGSPEHILWDRMNDNPTWGPKFSTYMKTFARDMGHELAKHVPVKSTDTRLLDLGGSHGMHSIRLCKIYPHLKSTIVDFEVALTDTPQAIEAAGMQERIALYPGNLLHHPWPDQQDVVLYLAVAHNQSSDDNQTVFKRIKQSLAPEGRLVIHEYLDDNMDSPFFAAFRLTLLLETGTQTYNYTQYATWLNAAGFTNIQRINLEPHDKGSLLIAS